MDDAKTFTIAPGEGNQRLDLYLVAQLPDLSRARIQTLVHEGHALLNGEKVRPGVKLRVGDVITLTIPPRPVMEAQPQDIALDILHEDEDLIVVNKAAGMVVHPALGNWEGTLVNALLHHCTSLSNVAGDDRPGIVHRLDKETSGCLVVAKSEFAHRSLARQFAGREIDKIYLAIARGHFRKPSGTIEAAIARHSIARKKMTVVEDERGREARTDYRVVQALGENSLVECRLHTGRTHQIRVHLKHIGHPICGDETYGRKGSWPRVMLHAWKLGFTHPRTEKRVNFESPIPGDFIEAGVPPQIS